MQAIINLFAKYANLTNSDVSSSSDMFELGIDSLEAVNLLLEINEAFNKDLGLIELFENPTPSSLFDVLSTS